MQKLDKSLQKELFYLFYNTIIMSVIMQVVFLLLKSWDYTVLLGNLFGAAAIMCYYVMLAFTVESAIKKEEKEARNFVKVSQSLRLLVLFAVCAVGVWLPCFHALAVVIPLIFPRISLLYRPLFEKKTTSNAAPVSNQTSDEEKNDDEN